MLSYDEEISRLQRDLIAARAGTGFYVEKENYEAMQTENTENRVRIEELESELASKLSELTNLMNDLQYMDDQYKLAYERLRIQSIRYARGIKEQENLKKVFFFKNSFIYYSNLGVKRRVKSLSISSRCVRHSSRRISTFA